MREGRKRRRSISRRLERSIARDYDNPDKWTYPADQFACPRCGGTHMLGHAHNEPVGLTCAACGWIRYADRGQLVDHTCQPPYPTPERAAMDWLSGVS